MAAIISKASKWLLIIEYLFAVLIVVLGFASIANLYRHYREYGL